MVESEAGNAASLITETGIVPVIRIAEVDNVTGNERTWASENVSGVAIVGGVCGVYQCEAIVGQSK